MSLYSLAIRWRFQPLRSVAFGSLSSSYTPLGAAMDFPIINYKISNQTDANLILSTDGINNHDVVPANGGFVYDIASNKGKGEVLALAKGDRLYVKLESASATSGSVYLTTVYASNN